jgi:hypothetical protein
MAQMVDLVEERALPEAVLNQEKVLRAKVVMDLSKRKVEVVEVPVATSLYGEDTVELDSNHALYREVKVAHALFMLVEGAQVLRVPIVGMEEQEAEEEDVMEAKGCLIRVVAEVEVS